MFYALCCTMLLIVCVAARDHNRVCAETQGYLGCTAVDWRNHTCLQWSDTKVQAQMSADNFSLNGSHSNYCRNLTKNTKAQCYTYTLDTETEVAHGDCEPVYCYTALQDDPLCWTHVTVNEGDQLILNCTGDKLGWTTPSTDDYLLGNGSLFISALSSSHNGEYNCSTLHWYNVTVTSLEAAPAEQMGPRKRYSPGNICSNKKGLCEVGAVLLLAVSVLAGVIIGTRGFKGLRSFNLRYYFTPHVEQEHVKEVYRKREDRLIPSTIWQYDAVESDETVAGSDRTMCYENHLTILRSQLEPSLKRGAEVRSEVRGGEVRGCEEEKRGSEVGTISGFEVYFSDSFGDDYGAPESV